MVQPLRRLKNRRKKYEGGRDASRVNVAVPSHDLMKKGGDTGLGDERDDAP